ncbi:RusA family crossover junction endodeoxyribonuclease [Serratia sp. P2ACOL2]|uniref:RusA family crossover junction endodeoxyribonuclease n=1 Tax=Serratia sp. P2ACOL2 TaxID=2482769 RepID=UPI000EFA67B0|nr:RusA family crossover junction endodeoxyribonuclease [Serratia sp. P2ACOL2]AYO37651.1 RusA family crossover junction endodeoxyribonuclease [Serratia sp. P2ACOL2]
MNLTLPFSPRVNGYWRSPNKGSSRGRTLVSERGRAFQAEAIAQVMKQLRRRPKPISADISVAVVFYPPTKARRDLDNFFKALFDAMTQAGVWLDDSQIKHIDAKWGPVTKGGKVELRISEVQA